MNKQYEIIREKIKTESINLALANFYNNEEVALLKTEDHQMFFNYLVSEYEKHLAKKEFKKFCQNEKWEVKQHMEEAEKFFDLFK